MAAERQPLDYAPPPAWHRRRAFRRIVVVVLLIAAVYPAAKLGPPLTRRVHLAWLHDRCASYTPSQTQVVYDNDPAAARALIGGKDYVAGTAAGGETVALRVPGALVELARHALPGYPAAARDLAAGASGATLFLHERRTPSGQRRLVIVQRPVGGEFLPAHSVLIAYVAKPLTFDNGTLKPPTVAPLTFSTGSAVAPFIGLAPRAGTRTTRLRCFAGQPDPSDPSRFTIAFENDGAPGVIEGSLKDDETVAFVSRSAQAIPEDDSGSSVSGTIDLSNPSGGLSIRATTSVSNLPLRTSANFEIEQRRPTTGPLADIHGQLEMLLGGATQPAASQSSR